MADTVQLTDKAGKKVDVADADAAKAIASGKYGTSAEMVPMTTESGITGMVPVKSLARALQTGQRGATRQEFTEAKDKALYDSSLKAGGLGLMKGVGESFLLPTDAIIGALPQGEAYKSEGYFADAVRHRGLNTEDLEGYRRQNPFASGAGELAGMIGAAALTEGGTLGALGSGAERVVGKGLLGTLARGTVEGAALGGVDAVNESALGNTDLTAEKVLAGIGHGALLGGAGAGVFHALGAAGASAYNKVADGVLDGTGIRALAKRAFGEAAPGIGEAVEGGLGSQLRDKYIRASSLASGADSEALEALTRGGSAGREARAAAVYDGDAILDSSARAMREHGDAVIKGNDVIYNQARGAMKRSYVDAAVKTGNDLETLAARNMVLDDALTRSDNLLSTREGHDQILESLSKSAYRVRDAGETNVDKFMALDQFKRETQTLMKSAKNTFQKTSDPTRRLQAESTYDALSKVEERVRTTLEDTSLWGKAGTDQAAINEQWTRSLNAKERFDQALTTKVGRGDFHDIRARDQLGIDPAKAESYVRNLTNPNKDLTHTAIRDYIDATDSFAKTLADRYELAPETAAQLTKAQGATKAFRGEVDKAEKTLTLVNQYKALGSSGVTDGLGVLGTLTGGVLGGVAGTAAGAVLNPKKAIAQLAAIERLANHVDTKMNGAISRLYSDEAAKLPSATKLLEAPKLPPRAAFEGQVKAIKDMAATGMRGIQDRVSAIAEGAPTIASAVAVKASSLTQFLASKAPPGFNVRPGLFPGQQQPVYSDSEMRTWARYAAAANNPLSVIDSIKSGTVSPQEAEVVQTFYPQLYAQMQTQIINTVAAKAQRGVFMPRQQRLSLGALFNVPTDVDLQPEFKAWLTTIQPQTEASEDPRGDASAAGAKVGKPINISVSGNASTEGQGASK